MVAKKVIVGHRQNLFDIALQEHGDIEGLADLLRNNRDFSIISDIATSTELYYRDPAVNEEVYQYFYKRKYGPATDEETNPAPLPPYVNPYIVILNLYPGITLELEAPTEYSVLPSKVVDEEGNVIELLGPNQAHIIYPVVITNSTPETLYELMPGEDQELPDATAKNSAATTIGTGPSGHPVPVPDIQVTQADGSTGDMPAGVDVTCLFPELDLVDTDGNVLETVTSMPVGAKIVAPDATVLRDGLPYGNVLAGGSIDVTSGLAPAGIKYQDVIQTHPTATSYATYDYAYNVINGYYDRVHPVTPVSVSELDTTIATANFGYVLKHNNKWGHKYRFTGSTGGYYDAVTATWYTVAGVASTRAAQVANGVIYDHLTGKQYLDRSTGNWAGALVSPATTFAAETGWLCTSIDDNLSLTINKTGGSNYELNDALPINAVWSSNSAILTSTNAYIARALGAIVSHASLVKTNTTATRLVWKYFT